MKSETQGVWLLPSQGSVFNITAIFKISHNLTLANLTETFAVYNPCVAPLAYGCGFLSAHRPSRVRLPGDGGEPGVSSATPVLGQVLLSSLLQVGLPSRLSNEEFCDLETKFQKDQPTG